MAETNTRCPRCNTVVHPEAQFCYHCGAALHTRTELLGPRESGRERSTWQIVGAVLLGIVGVIGAATAMGAGLLGSCMVLFGAREGVQLLQTTLIAALVACGALYGVYRLLR